jgi:uncharacterized protein (TIGR03437 family)
VTVFTSSDAQVPFQASAQALDTERNWLSVAPPSGTTSTGAPARIDVTVNPLGLNAGTFEGQVNTVVVTPDGDLDVRTVNVTMVVRPQGVVSAGAPLRNRAVDCAPASLSLTHTGLVSNFVTRVGWPTPLNVRLLDDCGQAVTDGQVVLSFSNGDPALALTHLRQGNYSGTWTPRTATEGGVAVRTEAFGRGLTAVFDLVGGVAPQATPVLTPNGVVNNYDPRSGAPLAPGTVVQIYGSGLAGGTVETPLQDGRLPDRFNDVAVLIGGMRAPLYFLSPGQINAQIPFELQAGDEYLLLIKYGRAYSVPIPVALTPRQPGLAAFAYDLGFQPVTESNPAVRGGYVVLYLVGMGVTNPAVPSASVSPADPFAMLTEPPVVRIDDVQAPVVFAGLAPGFVGLYQLNIQVPPSLSAGVRELVVDQAGVESNRVKLPVR